VGQAAHLLAVRRQPDRRQPPQLEPTAAAGEIQTSETSRGRRATLGCSGGSLRALRALWTPTPRGKGAPGAADEAVGAGQDEHDDVEHFAWPPAK
jgi:hypothetical protein